MIDLCTHAGLPEPEFTELSNAFVVTFRRSKLTRAYLLSLGLSERHITAVEYTRTHGRITNREYLELTGVSRRTATHELLMLVAKGLLTPEGKGRARHYRLQTP